jgi:hypothetical protein
MQNLTPVGLSQDGRRLLLVSPSGEEFAVPVDTRLRAALRGDNARLGQLEMKMESALRPRDIQARIRAGESAEDVATAAQTTVDAIMGFAGPVLAERAHVAQTALKASVRRRSGESSSAGTSLGEAAELFFGDHSLHDEDVEWDAWRRPDGRWALVATYAIEGQPRTAEFSHDLPGRYVVAENDEARILTGELREPDSRRPAGARAAQARRLSSVPSQDELPLGDDAIELVREPAADEPTDLDVEHTVEVPDPTADTADADWMAAADYPTLDSPADVPEDGSEDGSGDGSGYLAGSSSDDQRDAGPGALPDTEPAAAPPAGEVDDTTDAGPGTESVADAPAVDAPAPPKKKSRSSVPSWDEIMFGGGKSE